MHKGCELLEAITGSRPTCSAAPGWICNDNILEVKENFAFSFNSDTRGSHIFFPAVKNKILTTAQIPVTLPTYDEIIGHHGLNHETYNKYLLSMIKPERLNVLTIHAEAEGILCVDLFERFIKQALDQRICILPLGKLIEKFPSTDSGSIIQKEIEGRHGKVAFQST